MSKAAVERDEQLRGMGLYAEASREGMAALADALTRGLDPEVLGRMVTSKPGGISGGQVYNWSEGHSPLHFAALGPLSVVDPLTVERLAEFVARLVGRTTLPVESSEHGPSTEEVASHAGATSCDLGGCILRALSDRELTEDEMTQIEKLVPVALIALQRLQKRLAGRKIQRIPMRQEGRA